jgi:hypothetical protein
MNLGDKVSRTLSATARSFGLVVLQAGKPPLDADLNLIGQADWERFRAGVQAAMPSGFFMDPTRATDDFQFDENWSNYFVLGPTKDVVGSLEDEEEQGVVVANVNGWIIPVTGTRVEAEGEYENVVKLYPPPSSTYRIDLVFLEAWAALIRPNPSTANKPSASTLWKHGNVLYGGTNITDDLEDSDIGQETAARVQVQYRLRTFGQGNTASSGVALDVYPDGLDDPDVLGQGTAADPIAGLTFSNMRAVLGDAGLWRAGDGDPDNELGTIDGYTYAIPVAAIFRRNTAAFTAVAVGNPNHNGAFDRNPSAAGLPDPLDGARELLTGTLTAAITHTTDAVAVTVTGLNGSGLEDGDLVLANTFLMIDDEIVGLSAVNAGGGTFTISGRGRYGTAAVGHPAGSVVKFFTSHPDGLFADQIAERDVLDLRRAVTQGEWDYKRILEHNVQALLSGNLRTAWKTSGSGNSQGPVVSEVGYLLADGGTAVPNMTEALDGPDGVRTIWSDAAVIQPNVTLLLDHEATKIDGGVGFGDSSQFDTLVEWDVAPGFKPIGFQNTSGIPADSWVNGSHIQLFIGGADGNGGARGTFRDGATRAVRFLTPAEAWKTHTPTDETGNQTPITLRFQGSRGLEAPPVDVLNPENHSGPMYPWRGANFEHPFLVLGGLLNDTLRVEGLAATNLVTTDGVYEIDLGIDFDVEDTYFSLDANGQFENEPGNLGEPLKNGRKTLYGMLTNNGLDRTGNSSGVYVLLWGDADSNYNNGAFKVLGCGTAGYTHVNASNATSIVVQPLSVAPYTGPFDTGTGNSVTVEFRSQEHDADDISDYASRIGDLAIVLTDVGGALYGSGVTDADATDYPWATYNMNEADASYRVAVSSIFADKMLLSLTLQYFPGRGAEARVADGISRIALRSPGASYLRQAPGVLDPTFEAASGMPDDEIMFDSAHIQTWNRLPARGFIAPADVAYGGAVVGFTEQDREAEAFIDKGSKTLLFRPFRAQSMTLKAMTFTGLAPMTGSKTLIGDMTYPDATTKDSLNLATAGQKMGYPIPQEYMPRFGRQDIPYFDDDTGAATFLPGINHLFLDNLTLTSPVFNIIGGEDNVTAGTSVKPLFFVTNEVGSDYGDSSTTIGTVLNKPFYGARKVPADINDADPYAQDIIDRLAAVNSSDLGRGLRGIQLPPHIGIARLQGVFERADYEAKGGRTFLSNRWEVEADPATNLLRQDADRQTLFIFQDGAKDLTTQDHDHTYIIPSNVLDLTRIPGYVAGDEFEDFEYVVEAVVFVFSKGWINKNNFVLARRHTGAGATVVDGANTELEGVGMVLPSAAALNEDLYVCYNRPVYQGDPFGTRNGATRAMTDYTVRYGHISISDQFALATPVQQYDSSGFVPQTANTRAFQVLASLDFSTTLGTGKIGGSLYPGTPLDIGYTENSANAAVRRPSAVDAPNWRVLPRAFSEGQKTNPSRASAKLTLLDADELIVENINGNYYPVTIHKLNGETVPLYGTAALWESDLLAEGVSENGVFIVDQTSKVEMLQLEVSQAFDPVTMLAPRDSAVIAFPGVRRASADGDIRTEVFVTDKFENDKGTATFYAEVTDDDEVTVTLIYNANPTAFEVLPDGEFDGASVFTAAIDFPDVIADGFTDSYDVTVTGVTTSMAALVAIPSTPPAGFVFRAECLLNTVRVWCDNHTGVAVAPGAFATAKIVVFSPPAIANWTITPGTVDLTLTAITTRPDPSVTLANMAACINAHPLLKETVTAIHSRGSSDLILQAVPTGAEGNGIGVEIGPEDFTKFNGMVSEIPCGPVEDVWQLSSAPNNAEVVGATRTFVYLSGGVDLPLNAGNGTTQLKLTGLTERLPLGALVQDSDFLCENPLGDKTSALRSMVSNISPVQSLLPLTGEGDEATRFTGAAGELIAMSDGFICTTDFEGYHETDNPLKTKKFRLHRGGGSAFVLSGTTPGGPVDWVSGSFPAASRPVLKGGLLACKALLVRNFYEEALSGPFKVSDGDELQMVILTNAVFGNEDTALNGLTINGTISPTGYGEGYAAADRFRINGRPMIKTNSRRVRNPAAIDLINYPETVRTGTVLDTDS